MPPSSSTRHPINTELLDSVKLQIKPARYAARLERDLLKMKEIREAARLELPIFFM